MGSSAVTGRLRASWYTHIQVSSRHLSENLAKLVPRFEAGLIVSYRVKNDALAPQDRLGYHLQGERTGKMMPAWYPK